MKKNDKKINVSFIILFFSIILFVLSFFHIESDYFWHIKAGEYMFSHGILKEDIFSWYVSGKYWMSHEWLFEVLLFGLKKIFSSFHVWIYCITCLICYISLCFYPQRKELSKNIPYSLLFITFFVIMLVPFVQARPHLLSICLFTFTFYALYDFYWNEKSKKIYFLPLIAVLWSNFHGGSSNLSYVFCFLFWIIGHISFQYKKIEANRISKKQLRTYFLIMIGCMLAVMMNPHGYRMFLYPYQNMADTLMISNISEWQPTSLNQPYHYSFYLFLVISLVTFLFSSKKIRFIDFILFGVVTYLGLKSIRFWLYGISIMPFLLFYYVGSRKKDKGSEFVILILSLAACLFFAFSIDFSVPSYYCLDEEVITILKEEKPNRLYNIYQFGGELVYYDIPVFIDGRADLYSPYNYEDYLNISRLGKDYPSLIDTYQFDYFLVDDHYSIYTYLKYNSSYEEIYHHNDIYLYKKIVN